MTRTTILATLALIAWLATSTSPVVAQLTGSIVGEVVDDTTLEPLVGASVAVVSTETSTVTNADGHFSLQGVPAGMISVRVEQVGYVSIVGEIEVSPATVTFVQFPLAAMAFLLDELRVVVDSEKPTPETAGGTFTEIFPDEGDASFTALDLLMARVPSLSVREDASAAGRNREVRIRGIASVTGSNLPSIYVDGVVSDMDALSDLSASEIWRIRVLRGPSASSLYPDAANGVILVERLSSRRSG